MGNKANTLGMRAALNKPPANPKPTPNLMASVEDVCRGLTGTELDTSLCLGLQEMLFRLGTKKGLELMASALLGHADGHLNALDDVEDDEAEEARIRADAAAVEKIAAKVKALSDATPEGL